MSVERLHIVPCDLDEANAFVEQRHRHLGVARGCKFTLAVAAERGVKPEEVIGDRVPMHELETWIRFDVVGVAIVGRPVARGFDNGMTVEINRLCTDGTPNAGSMLYARCKRIALQLGYRRIVTYSLPEESGASLRGAGYRLVGLTSGGSWDCQSRPRIDKHPLQGKLLWEAVA